MYVTDLSELSSEDHHIVGGKAANLGQLIKAGIPVPPGFAVTVSAFEKVMSYSNVKQAIQECLRGFDLSRIDAVEATCKKVRTLIEVIPIPEDVAEAILSEYYALARKLGVDDPEVAVRSSATVEDSAKASFAGQMESYLFVRGGKNVLESVKKCFSSAFTPRALAYNPEVARRFQENGTDAFNARMGVVVQAMVNCRSAGVMFTLNPSTGDPNIITIEGVLGVGEPLTQGTVNPDRFFVEKSNLSLIDRQIASKDTMVSRNPDQNSPLPCKELSVPTGDRTKPSLSEDQVMELAEYARRIEKFYARHVDIEWALDESTGKLFIVQARPETAWEGKKQQEVPSAPEGQVLVRGMGASPGTAVGRVRVLPDLKAAASFQEGEVLVAPMTTPDWLPTMKKAKAIVTDVGGMTSHTAIVSREQGIPCVIGAKNATQVLKTGIRVAVDGSLGFVYESAGRAQVTQEKPLLRQVQESAPVTATKIFMNLSDPDKMDEYADLPFDGIGLMRLELIIAGGVRDHPLTLIEEGKPEVFVDKVAYGIAKVARALYPRPVIVRFSDFKSNEFRALRGGEKFEPQENNPMIGWRGVSRYIHPKYEPGFRLECRAFKKVREEMRLKNVWILLPFIRNTWEIEEVLRIMGEEGLKRNRDLKVWLMAEVPSMVILAEEFMPYCDGISIGSNDLVQLVLGVDRDSDILGDMGYFDERDPAVLKSMMHLIKTAHAHGVTVSICGQAPSVYPEVTAFLVENGIDCVSVNPDTVASTRKLVASLEQKAILKKLAERTGTNESALSYDYRRKG